MFCYHLPTDSPEVKDDSGVFMQKIHHRVHRHCGIILPYLTVLSVQSETLTIHLVKHTGKKTSNMEQRYLLFAEDFWLLINILYWKKSGFDHGRALPLKRRSVYCFSKLLCDRCSRKYKSVMAPLATSYLQFDYSTSES